MIVIIILILLLLNQADVGSSCVNRLRFGVEIKQVRPLLGRDDTLLWALFHIHEQAWYGRGINYKRDQPREVNATINIDTGDIHILPDETEIISVGSSNNKSTVSSPPFALTPNQTHQYGSNGGYNVTLVTDEWPNVTFIPIDNNTTSSSNNNNFTYNFQLQTPYDRKPI